ncbi:MAG: IS4 family transposase [Sideroxyarcus sp.]|nr:IS4 family transposase [Sideroxyarcus sp.]
MNFDKTLFAQTMEFVPWTSFARIVARYGGVSRVRNLICTEQFRAMAFAQLTCRESLRDIETCLLANQAKLYGMGFHSPVKRSTLADANEGRDWRIWADLAALLVRRARKLYCNDSFGVDLDNTVYALDATTIDLCLSLFPWAPFRSTKAAVKLHTLHQSGAFFVTRAKHGMDAHRVYSMSVDRCAGIICDQRIASDGFYVSQDYPEQLRRIRFKDPETGKTLVFLTNNTPLPALTIAALYKSCWQVELFFKWIKQHLRIKRFIGNSENAVKTQIWCAISTYVLIAIVKKELQLDASLYKLLQILSVPVFEKTKLSQALAGGWQFQDQADFYNQLNLFDF